MSTETVATAKIFDIIQYDVNLGKWRTKTFEKARRGPGVRVIIDNGQWQVLLSKEHRYELWRDDMRLPGGKVHESREEFVQLVESWASLDTAVLDAACKECLEEVGVICHDPVVLSCEPCGATIDRDLWYVVVREFEEEHMTEHEAGEDNCIHWHDRYDYADVLQMITQGTIAEWRTVAVLMRYLAKQWFFG